MSPFKLFTILVGLILAVMAVYPLLRVVTGLFITPDGVTLAPILEMFALPDISSLLWHTAVVVLISGTFGLLIGAVLAWLNERTDARIGSFTDSLPLIPFFLPPIAGAVGWVLLLAPQAGFINGWLRWVVSLVGMDLSDGPLNIYTWYGLIFVYILYQVPYSYMLIANGLRNADPNLDEQSRICGAGVFKTLRKVTFPLVKSALGGAVLLMVIEGFGIFSVPLIIGDRAGVDILSVRIVELLTGSYPPRIGPAVGLSIIILVVVGLTWYWQLRLLRKGRFGTLSGKGQRVQPIELGRWRWLGRSLLLGYGMVAIVLPVAALVLVALNGYWTLSIKWASLNLKTVTETLFGDSQSLAALQNSLFLGVVGATIGMIAAMVVSLYVRDSKSRFSAVVDGAIKLPSIFPHLVLGVGVLLAFAGPPLRLGGTLLILLIVYVSMYLPRGSVTTDAAISQVGLELSEASAVSGAKAGRTFRKIYFPLVLPGLVAGWTFLFARMVGDLTATALLAGPGNTAAGFRIMEIFTNGDFAQLASFATVLTFLTSVIVVIALALARVMGKWQAPKKKFQV